MTIQTDAVIVGAGPVGLFQAFQLGLQDIRCHIVDALPYVGGQCVELYGDKPIYDIPGVPLCTGRQLVEQLQQQIKPFAPTLHLNQEVISVNRLPRGELDIRTSAQQHFVCKTLFIAAGVGAFQARKLTVDGAQAFEGTQLHYRLGELAHYANQDVWVIGGEETAVSAALQLVHQTQLKPRSVTLMHRRDVFQAAPELEKAMRDAVAQGQLRPRRLDPRPPRGVAGRGAAARRRAGGDERRRCPVRADARPCPRRVARAPRPDSLAASRTCRFC